MEKSPYSIACYEDGSLEISFAVNGKNTIKLKLDKDNRYKLATDLLKPHKYKPKRENFIVCPCQSE